MFTDMADRAGQFYVMIGQLTHHHETRAEVFLELKDRLIGYLQDFLNESPAPQAPRRPRRRRGRGHRRRRPRCPRGRRRRLALPPSRRARGRVPGPLG
ncbi:MAG: DUF2397 family protein [Acidimicrobiia bacterium]|nr:DUF2397 family protein [Acidimicrobiia bacterium]